MHDVRQARTERTQQLRQIGYHVIEMWECQWNAMKKVEPDIQTFVEQLDIDTPLNPRDAFFGGTNQCHHTSLQSRTSPANSVCGRNIALPMGQQKWHVRCGPS